MLSEIIDALRENGYKVIDFTRSTTGIYIIDDAQQVSERIDFALKTKTFDIVAKKQEKKLIIKFIDNVDNISRKKCQDLINMARIFDCVPLIVGMFNRNGILEENVLYQRYSINTVGLKTFLNIIQEERFPRIYSGRGGFFVQLEGSSFKELRQSRNFSLNDIAKSIGVTSKAVYEYEANNMKTRLEHVKSLAKLFGYDTDAFLKEFSEAINIFERIQEGYYRLFNELNQFQDEIDQRLHELGFQTFWFKKSPIDLSFEEESRVIEVDERSRVLGVPRAEFEHVFHSRIESVDEGTHSETQKLIRKIEKRLERHVAFLNRIRDALNIRWNMVMLLDDKIFEDDKNIQGVPIIHKDEIPSENAEKFKRIISNRKGTSQP